MFENRSTGRITIAQRPNIPLAVFLGSLVVRGIAHPTGAAGRTVDVVGTAALVLWALDEVLRGVNPFRRLLGGTVLVGQVLTLVARLRG